MNQNQIHRSAKNQTQVISANIINKLVYVNA